MRRKISQSIARDELQALARFRAEIRRFLHFSEKAATAAGLEPQQHQLLLQVVGVPEGTLPTVTHIAEALSLAHHTAVELSKRCEGAGLIRRTADRTDRRRVILEVTARGEKALQGLSEVHAEQLRELAPVLIQALTRIRGGAEQPTAAKSSGKEGGVEV